MCDPLTITAAIGTAVAAGSAIYGGVQQQQVQKQNAKVAQQAAGFEADASRDRAKRLLAAQRAGYAKAGVTLEGSPLDVIADTAQQTKLDELVIRWGGAQRARAFRQEGDADLMSGIGAGASALLTGATSWGDSLLKPKTTPPTYSSLGQRGV